jgi:hypothetical protein
VETDVKISTLGNATKLKNLTSGEILEGKPPAPRGPFGRNGAVEDRYSFTVHLPPHSYAAFSLENDHENH